MILMKTLDCDPRPYEVFLRTKLNLNSICTLLHQIYPEFQSEITKHVENSPEKFYKSKACTNILNIPTVRFLFRKNGTYLENPT